MNYYANIALEGKEYPLLVATSIDDKFYNVKEILSAQRVATNVYLNSDEGIEFPFLVVEDSDGQDIGALVRYFSNPAFKPSEQMFQGLSAKINGQLSATQLNSLFECNEELNSYLKGDKVTIKLQPSWFLNYTRTKELVDKINSSGKASELFIDGKNETKFMSKPTDELFLAIPSYEEIAMANGALIPEKSTFMIPYEDNRLSSVNYRMYLKDTPMEHVLGSPENNTLDIQPNEQRFYNSLVSLMNYGISQEFPDKTIEECVANGIGSTVVLEYIKSIALVASMINWSHTGFIPVSSISALMEEDDDAPQEDEVGSSEMESNKAYGMDNLSIETFVDGELVIQQIIDKAFSKDIYEPIKIAIKLLRWGSRKPTRLFIEHTQSFLDLNAFTFVRSSGNFVSTEIESNEKGNNLFIIGNVVASDIVSDRRYMNSLGLKSTNLNIPVGVMCERKYKNSNEKQVIFVSYIDIIKAYNNNESLCKIEGISMENGRLILSPEAREILDGESIRLSKVCDHVKTNNSSTFVYYVYDGFKDAYMEFGALDRRLSILSLINNNISSNDLSKFSKYAYNTKQELESVIKAFMVPPVDAISYNILSYILPIFLQVNEISENALLTSSGEEMSTQEIIDLFIKVMDKNGFTGNFITDKQIPKVPESTVKSSAFGNEKPSETPVEQPPNQQQSSQSVAGSSANIMTGEVFMDRSEVTVPVIKLVVAKDIYDKLIVAGADIRSLSVERTDTGERVVIGLLTKVGSQVKMLDPMHTAPKSKSCANLKVLPRVLVSNIQSLINGTEIKFKFQNEEVAKYYCSIIDKYLSIM